MHDFFKAATSKRVGLFTLDVRTYKIHNSYIIIGFRRESQIYITFSKNLECNVSSPMNPPSLGVNEIHDFLLNHRCVSLTLAE